MPLLISITGADLPDENEGTVGIYEGSGGIVGICFFRFEPFTIDCTHIASSGKRQTIRCGVTVISRKLDSPSWSFVCFSSIRGRDSQYNCLPPHHHSPHHPPQDVIPSPQLSSTSSLKCSTEQ